MFKLAPEVPNDDAGTQDGNIIKIFKGLYLLDFSMYLIPSKPNTFAIS